MIIGSIEGTNLTLNKPVDWDDSKGLACGALPVIYEETEYGPLFVSAWFPTPAELELLNKGAPVYLFVYANRHPPVAIGVKS